MKQNVGTKESYVRIGLGLMAGLAAIGWSRSRVGRSLLGMAAVSGLQSGLTRYCALKHLMGVGDTTDSSLNNHNTTYARSSFDNDAIPQKSQAI